MASNIFMRGENFPDSGEYYIVGRKGSQYFYLIQNADATLTYNGTTVNYLMYSLSYTVGGFNVPPCKVNFSSTGTSNPVYSISAYYNNYAYYFTIQNGIINLTSTSVVNLSFKSSNANFVSNKIYPGAWYKTSMTNGTTGQWPAKSCSSVSGPFCTKVDNVIVLLDIEIMFIPTNTTTNPISAWSHVDGSADIVCAGNTDETLGLTFFESWTGATSTYKPVNCNSGYLSQNSVNCLFSNFSACNNGYLYQFCTGSETCGNCMGVCTSNYCIYGNPGETPPLLCGQESSDDTSTDDTVSSWAIIIFAIIVGVFILLLFWFIYKQSKKSSFTPETINNADTTIDKYYIPSSNFPPETTPGPKPDSFLSEVTD